jgi:hypothetical protein
MPVAYCRETLAAVGIIKTYVCKARSCLGCIGRLGSKGERGETSSFYTSQPWRCRRYALPKYSYPCIRLQSARNIWKPMRIVIILCSSVDWEKRFSGVATTITWLQRPGLAFRGLLRAQVMLLQCNVSQPQEDLTLNSKMAYIGEMVSDLTYFDDSFTRRC